MNTAPELKASARATINDDATPQDARRAIVESGIIADLYDLWMSDGLHSWELAAAKILELQHVNTVVIRNLTDKREAQAQIIESKFPSATRRCPAIITRQEIDEAKGAAS